MKEMLKIAKRDFWPLSFIFVFIFINFRAESDTWWLLRAGEETWSGNFLTKETWSYTSEGNYWPNHEFLFEVILYAFWSASFNNFVLAGIIFSLTTIFSLFLLFYNKNVQHYLARDGKVNFYIYILVAFVAATITTYRPNILSILFFALLLNVLINKKYYWTPVIMLFWANSHGSFVVGGVILFLTAVASLLSYLWGQESSKNVKHLWLYGVLSFTATFLNPLGFKLWTYIFESFNKTSAAVTEFEPLWHNTLTLILFIDIVLLTLPLLYLKRKVLYHWPVLVILVAYFTTGIMAIFVVRFWVFFTIPACALILFAFMSEPSVKKWLDFKIIKAILLSLVALFFIYGVTAQMAQSKPALPAVMSNAVINCENNAYNDYESGGYLLWLEKDYKVFQDNRYDPYGETVKDLIIINEQDSWEDTFSQYNITCALMQVNDPGLYILLDQGWTVQEKEGKWRFLTTEKSW